MQNIFQYRVFRIEDTGLVLLCCWVSVSRRLEGRPNHGSWRHYLHSKRRQTL